jgi:hypothetical protein
MSSAPPPHVPNIPFSDDDVTVFTIGDDGFFPGVVGLINSLRALGYPHRMVVADCGFSASQRQLLAPHATLIPLARDAVKNPQQYKAFASLVQPRGTVVAIDSDIIVTSRFNDMLAAARDGRIGVFPDPEENRWFGEWQELFGLALPPRRQVYVNSGFVVFSATRWPHLLERWWNACERIFSNPTIREGAARDNPTSQSDQDALNAILMSEIPAEAVAYQDRRAMVFRWDFEKVRVEDAATLKCSFDGARVVALHAVAGPKPWQPGAAGEASSRNAYVRLLRRLLVADDAAVKVPADELPAWLRRGFAGRLRLESRAWLLRARSLLPRNTGLVARARKIRSR